MNNRMAVILKSVVIMLLLASFRDHDPEPECMQGP